MEATEERATEEALSFLSSAIGQSRVISRPATIRANRMAPTNSGGTARRSTWRNFLRRWGNARAYAFAGAGVGLQDRETEWRHEVADEDYELDPRTQPHWFKVRDGVFGGHDRYREFIWFAPRGGFTVYPHKQVPVGVRFRGLHRPQERRGQSQRDLPALTVVRFVQSARRALLGAIESVSERPGNSRSSCARDCDSRQ